MNKSVEESDGTPNPAHLPMIGARYHAAPRETVTQSSKRGEFQSVPQQPTTGDDADQLIHPATSPVSQARNISKVANTNSPDPFAQFEVIKESGGSGSENQITPALRVLRPSTKDEVLQVPEPRFVHQSAQDRLIVTGAKKEPDEDLARMSTRELLMRVMPTENQVRALGMGDRYSNLLCEANYDAFAQLQLTPVYKELENRFLPVHLQRLLLFESSLENYKKETVAQMPTEKIIKYLAMPQVRQEVILQLLEIISPVKFRLLLLELEFGEYSWQKGFVLATKSHSTAITSYLMAEHWQTIVEILSSDDFTNYLLGSLGIEEIDFIENVFLEFRIPYSIDNYQVEFQASIEKYQLTSIKSKIYENLKDNNFIVFVFQNFKHSRNKNLELLLNSVEKDNWRGLLEQFQSLNFLSFLTEFVLNCIKTATRRDKIVSSLNISDCSADCFYEQIIKRLPSYILQILHSNFHNIQDYAWILAKLDEVSFCKLLELIPPEQLNTIAEIYIPFEAIVEMTLSKIADFEIEKENSNQGKAQMACCKKNPKQRFANNDNKSDTLIEADPIILQDFWHQGSYSDTFCSMPHSFVFGFNGRYQSLADKAWGVLHCSTSDGEAPSHSWLIDSSSARPVALLPGVYFAFLNKQGDLCTFTFTDSTHTAGQGGSYIPIAIVYDIGALPRLVEKKRYNMKDASLDRKTLRLAASYTSACEGSGFPIKALYSDDFGNCRAFANGHVDYEDFAAKIVFPENFERSNNCNMYFFDNCKQFAVIDREKLVYTIFSCDNRKNQSQVTVKLKVHISIDLAVYLSEEDKELPQSSYTLMTRDSFSMKNKNKPLPLICKKTVWEVEIDKNEGHLQLLIQAGQFICSLAITDEYAIYLCTTSSIFDSPSLGKISLTVSKKELNKLEKISQFDGKDYDRLFFNGQIILLQKSDNFKIHVASLFLQEIQENIAHEIDTNGVNCMNSDLYATKHHDLEIRKCEDDTLIHTISKSSIDTIWGQEVYICKVVLNSNFSKGLLICQPVIKDEKSSYLLAGINLQDQSFYRFDLKVSLGAKMQAMNSHLAISNTSLTQIYYFDLYGRLLLASEFDIKITDQWVLQTINEVWIYKNDKEGKVGFKNHILNEGQVFKDAKICKQPFTQNKFAVYYENMVMFNDYDDFLKNLQQSNGNHTKLMEMKYNWINRHLFNGLLNSCLDSTGSLLYTVQLEQSYVLYKNTISGSNRTTKKIYDLGIGSHSFNNLSISFTTDCQYVVIKYFSDLKSFIKVFGVKNNDLLYSAEEQPKYADSLSILRVSYNFNTFSMISKIENQIFFFKDHQTPINKSNKMVVFRFLLFNYLYANQKSDEEKEGLCLNIKKFFCSVNPVVLSKERGIFLILANMNTPELLELFINHCTLRNLLVYGHLLEWLFANERHGRWLRGHLLANFDSVLQVDSSEVDLLAPDLFDKLVMYRFTPQLLKEPNARTLFFRLLRVPLVASNTRKQLALRADDSEIDLDYDTGCFTPKGSFGDQTDELVKLGIQELRNKLQEIKGNNLAPYQIFVSATPVELTIGSKVSVQLFQLLSECPSEELNGLLRPFIYLYWKSLFNIASAYMMVYWLFASICYAFYGFQFKSYGLGVTIISMSFLFLAYETLAMRSLGKKYFRSVWNIIDILSHVGCLVTVPLLWTQDVETRGWAVGRCVVLVLVWTRAIVWLKVFRAVRHLITMVLQVFADIRAFLTVLAAAIFGLAFVWRLSFYFGPDEDPDIANRETVELVPTFFSSLQTVTFIILGNLPGSESDGREFSIVKFLVVVAFGIILALVLTNFLIAIIGTTYSNVQEKKQEHDLSEVISLIVDFNATAASLNRCCWFSNRKYVLSLHKQEEETPDVS
jgi:hypothetical protein